MLENLVPTAVAVASRSLDDEARPLFAEEEALVSGAVPTRRREFQTGRACAREALRQLGYSAAPIPADRRGAPIWPDGVVGSITHCSGFRGAVAAQAGVIAALGIDAEPNRAVPRRILGDIMSPQEAAWVTREQPKQEIALCRLLFCAREAVFKAWYPHTQRWLGFDDVRIDLKIDDGTFDAHLLVAGPRCEGKEVAGYQGRWGRSGDLLMTAIAMTWPEYRSCCR